MGKETKSISMDTCSECLQKYEEYKNANENVLFHCASFKVDVWWRAQEIRHTKDHKSPSLQLKSGERFIPTWYS